MNGENIQEYKGNFLLKLYCQFQLNVSGSLLFRAIANAMPL